MIKFKESALAHQYLDGLVGLEIGGSAHNSFGLNTKNVDYTDDMNTIFKLDEIKMCGEALPVDIVANGDNLPIPDKSVDFVISSHVIEHFFDPIKAIKEWIRVSREYIYIICPHKERTFDKDRQITPLQELINRHNGIGTDDGTHEHHSVFITTSFLQLMEYMKLNVIDYQHIDDKVGNGFAIVIKL